MLGNWNNSTKGCLLLGTRASGLLMGMLLSAALYLGSRPTRAAEPTTPPALTPERLFASPDLEGARPRHLQLSPDGRWLALIRNRQDDKNRYDLWVIDATNGAQHLAVDSAKGRVETRVVRSRKNATRARAHRGHSGGV
jgi:dipeptidyl-peptidase-4